MPKQKNMYNSRYVEIAKNCLAYNASLTDTTENAKCEGKCEGRKPAGGKKP